MIGQYGIKPPTTYPTKEDFPVVLPPVIISEFPTPLTLPGLPSATALVVPPPPAESWPEQEWIAGVKNKWLLAGGAGVLLLSRLSGGKGRR